MHAQHFLPRLESCNTNTELVARYKYHLPESGGQVARYNYHLPEGAIGGQVVRWVRWSLSGICQLTVMWLGGHWSSGQKCWDKWFEFRTFLEYCQQLTGLYCT